MALRDHEPIEISEFNGLWRRGDPDDTPLDHFSNCENIQFESGSGFLTRAGINIFQHLNVPLTGILRIYNFPTPTANTLLVLTTGGNIYHVIDDVTVFGPILTKALMTDFGFAPFAGRAYITPFFTDSNGIERGLENEFMYVYLGDGLSVARPAGVIPPVNAVGDTFAAALGTGASDAGFHIFGVIYETDTGALSAPGPNPGFATLVQALGSGVSFVDIPVSPSLFVTKRHIVATKTIPAYNGDEAGYQFFFLPGGTINDNVATTLSNISYFDSQLLEDASHLIDNFSEIPAGVNITFYHNRLVLNTTFDDISIAYVSAPGEPESINQVDGILIAPLDGNPLTIFQELRDVLYGFKRNRTHSWVDNGAEPSTWPLTTIDYGLGCPVHGIATVLDSGASSIDYLLTAAYQGMQIFNGRYANPELSWKIKDFWQEIDREQFRRIQILNDPVRKIIYIVLPDRLMLTGDYNIGLDPKAIRWAPYRADIQFNTIALININTLIIGAEQRLLS